MAELADKFSEEIEQLRGLRDELRVRLHLGGAEARERWEKLEKDLERAQGKLKQLKEASREDLADVGAAVRNLVGEIRSSYEHLKSLL